MRAVLLWMIRAYQWTKPMRPPACRFWPSCSSYAYGAISRHGILKGLTLAGWRLLRCHPLCDGGADEVPVRFSDAFRVFRSVLKLSR